MMDSRTNTLRTLFVVFLAVSYIFVALRVYIQWQIAKSFGADDCFLIAALASFTIYTAAGMLSIQNGLGTSNIDDTAATTSVGLRFWLMAEIHYVLTCTLLRLAAIIQLRKLAKCPKQRRVIYCLAAATVIYNTGFFLLLLFQVAPVQYFWKGWFGKEFGSNIDPDVMAEVSYGFAGVGTGTDWLLVVVSLWFFWEQRELELGRNAKIGLRILLLIGIGAGAAGLVRIPTTSRLLTTDDFLSDCVPIAIGCILESGLGMVAISASTFRSLCPSFFDKPPKPTPPIPLELTEKRMSRDSDSTSSTSSSSSGDSSGAQVANNTIQRKVSEEKKKGVKQDA